LCGWLVLNILECNSCQLLPSRRADEMLLENKPESDCWSDDDDFDSGCAIAVAGWFGCLLGCHVAQTDRMQGDAQFLIEC